MIYNLKLLAYKLLLKNIVRNFNTILRQPSYCRFGVYPQTISNPCDLFENLKDDSKIYIQGGAMTPTFLVKALSEHGLRNKLKNIRTYHLHTEGDWPLGKEELKDTFRGVSLFTGQSLRKPISEGRADYIPIFLSEIPLLFRRRIIDLDYALISVTPPDKHGYCSLGVSVDITRSAIENAKIIIAQINHMVPLTYGDAEIHISNIDKIINAPMPIHEKQVKKISKEEFKIGQLIANELIKDGATLQTGIGSIPDAVLSLLTKHKNLGVHTELYSDGLVDLVSSGAVTNSEKKLFPGKIVSSFVIGSNRVFDFTNGNNLIVMKDIAYVNNPHNIAKNRRVAAINSCIEIDLTGQVVSDSIGGKIYSGFGGQVDFIRGATICRDGEGVAIIALTSATKKCQSKIVPTLRPGAGVVTTRAHVQYVVTENGIAFLFGKSLRQRAYELIRIAHPDHRESLEKAAFEQLKIMPSID